MGRSESEFDLHGDRAISTNPFYHVGDGSTPVDAGQEEGTAILSGEVKDDGQAATSSKGENPTGVTVTGLDTGNQAHTSSPIVQSIDTSNPVNEKKPWSEILKPKVGVNRMKFEYHTPEVVDGRVVIKPPLLIDVLGRKAWENCLVGYFFEKRVAYHVMNYVAKRQMVQQGAD